MLDSACSDNIDLTNIRRRDVKGNYFAKKFWKMQQSLQFFE